MKDLRQAPAPAATPFTMATVGTGEVYKIFDISIKFLSD